MVWFNVSCGEIFRGTNRDFIVQDGQKPSTLESNQEENSDNSERENVSDDVSAVYDKYEHLDHSYDDIEPLIEAPTGWGRVKEAWIPDKAGIRTFEGYWAFNFLTVSFVSGFVIGGVQRSPQLFRNFISRNMGQRYISTKDAQRRAMDAVLYGIIVKGAKEGVRFVVLLGSSSASLATVTAYRNEFCWWYVPFCSALGGALGRFNFGPRGWAVGGATFSILTCAAVFPVLAGIRLAYGKPLDDIYKEARIINYQQQAILARDESEIQLIVDKCKEDGQLFRLRSTVRREMEANRALRQLEHKEMEIAKRLEFADTIRREPHVDELTHSMGKTVFGE